MFLDNIDTMSSAPLASFVKNNAHADDVFILPVYDAISTKDASSFTTTSSTDVLHRTEALYFLPSSGLVGPKNRIGVRKHDVRITVMTFYLT